MIPHAIGRMLLTPVDSDAPVRTQRLRDLGLGERSDASFDNFDAFADRVAEVAEVPFSMVNFIDGNRQFYAGLHTRGHPQGRRPGRHGGGQRPQRALCRPRPRLLPARRGPAKSAGPGGRLRLPAVRREPGRRRHRHPLLPRGAAHRPDGDRPGRRLRGGHRAPPVGRAGLDTIKSLAQELIGHIHSREDISIGI